jgi:hypothetical protein
MASDDLQYYSASVLNSVSVEKVENIHFYLTFLTFQTKLNLKLMLNNIVSHHWHVRDGIYKMTLYCELSLAISGVGIYKMTCKLFNLKQNFIKYIK